jgi:hypothetical protein
MGSTQDPVIKTHAFVLGCLFTLTVPAADSTAFKPLQLLPENPHYFLFRGKPTVLVTSGEHYGAVLNQDFDYLTYLDTLKAEGMNLTRVVPGTSLESTNATTYRGGDQNTFAPRPGRFLAPWARSDTPGYFYGGNKFDLDRWDEAFFKRLKDFVSAASERGIIVEFNVFYVLYGDGPEFGKWNLHPLNARNNVNHVGHVPFHRYNTLDEPALVARQEAVLRKLLTELNEFDNVYYEICDEPYCSGASPKETESWQNHLLGVAEATMRMLPRRQLLAVNYANDYTVVQKPHRAVSVLNFHYSYPPAVVPLNWQLSLPICFDETSGGQNVLERRREAWAFMLSGGAVYNNLDPSFATDDPTGSGKVQQPDGRFDGRALRKQLRILREFMERLDFTHMQPDRSAVAIPPHPGGCYALLKPGESVAVYVHSPRKELQAGVLLDLPKGRWQADWLHPATGEWERTQVIDHPGGGLWLHGPGFTNDIAVRLQRAELGSESVHPGTKP